MIGNDIVKAIKSLNVTVPEIDPTAKITSGGFRAWYVFERDVPEEGSYDQTSNFSISSKTPTIL
jgi:hypothetical protein